MMERPHPSQFTISIFQAKMINGAIAWGIVYCAMVFAGSLSLGKLPAMLVTIASAGVTYLSFVIQVGAAFPPVVQRATVGLSIVLGLVAGLLLLV